MKKVLSVAFLSVGVFLFSTVAMAYDDLITNDTSIIKEAGSMTAQGNIFYQTADKAFDENGDKVDVDFTGFRIPLKFSWVVLDKLEGFAILPFASDDFNGESNSGIGDMWLGAKYGLMSDGLLTLRGSLDIPTGDDDKGLGNGGGFGIDLGAMTTKQFDAIKINGQAGLYWYAEDSDTKWQPGIGFYADAEGSYKFTDKLAGQIGLEYFAAGDGKLDGTKDTSSAYYQLELNVGANYLFTDKFGIKGDILYTFIGENVDNSIGILAALTYAVK